MKHIKKLSSKLLLALGVIILSAIVWQVIVTKQIISDTKKIKQVQSIGQMHELFKSGELKTFSVVSHQPFSKIKLSGISAEILKGDEYAVYVSDYFKRHIGVTVKGDELFIDSLKKFRGGPSVFIFTPEDPQLISCAYSGYVPHGIFGFKGDNTLLSYEGDLDIKTDMPYINVNQKGGYVSLYTFGLDSLFRIDNIQINANIENGVFSLRDYFSKLANIDIQLQESAIGFLTINNESTLGTLKLTGSYWKKDDYHNHFCDNKKDPLGINYSGQADSLIIRLTGNPEKQEELFLRNLSGKFEDINVSDNIRIVRE
ncbi:MAG: hypothetical protein LBI82_13385 [Dysgonamonadaceae bacterium]|jgi:hypothetical protein|nr:hypothetical protein [Dysgonamonadaceae bacterium]